MNRMAQTAITKLVIGKASEINGKAKRKESGVTPQNETLMDTAIDFVKDNDETVWVNAFTLTDTTYALST